jgi:hypothetical protein
MSSILNGMISPDFLTRGKAHSKKIRVTGQSLRLLAGV